MDHGMQKYPKECRAAVLKEYGAPSEIERLPVPELQEDGIIVKMLLAGICGTDVHQHDGDLSIKTPLPIIQGHEAIGRIVAMGGKRVQDVAGQILNEGDRIMWSHSYCGECYSCGVLKKPNMCDRPELYGYGTPNKLIGGFAEYAYVLPKAGVVKVPDVLSDEEALGVGCAFRSVVNGFEKLFDHGGIRTGDSVVVQGAGPIGLYSAVLAAQSGAARIIVIGAPAIRLELAKKWGATDVINIEEEGDAAVRLQMVKELTGGKGADVVVEGTGVPISFNEGMEMLRKGGIYLVLGQTSTRKIEFMPNLFLQKQAVVLGSGSADITHYYKALKFMEMHRKRYPFAELVNRTYRLEEIDLALENMKKGEDIKGAIDFR